IDHVSRVVAIPVAGQEPAVGYGTGEQSRTGVRRLNVKRRGRDPLLDRPIHRPPEHALVIVVHAEDEAAVDHDAEAVQPPRDGRIVTPEVLAFVASGEVGRRKRLEADEQTAQSRLGGALDDIVAEDRVDGGRALKKASHAAHAVEERGGKAAIAEEMIVEEVEVAARQPVDFSEGGVDTLRVEGASALEERVLVAEV